MDAFCSPLYSNSERNDVFMRDIFRFNNHKNLEVIITITSDVNYKGLIFTHGFH